jgi:hypothetical protein
MRESSDVSIGEVDIGSVSTVVIENPNIGVEEFCFDDYDCLEYVSSGSDAVYVSYGEGFLRVRMPR